MPVSGNILAELLLGPQTTVFSRHQGRLQLGAGFSLVASAGTGQNRRLIVDVPRVDSLLAEGGLVNGSQYFRFHGRTRFNFHLDRGGPYCMI